VNQSTKWWNYLNALQNLVVIVDHKDRIFYANEAMQRFTGLSPRVVNKNPTLWEIVARPDNFPDSFALVDESWLSRNCETTALEVSGDLMPVNMLMTRIEEQEQFEDSASQPEGGLFLLVMTDISLEVKLQDKYRNKLRENQSLIDQLKRKISEVEFLRRLSGISTYRSTLDDIFVQTEKFGIELLKWEQFVCAKAPSPATDSIELLSKHRLGSHTRDLLTHIQNNFKDDPQATRWSLEDLMLAHIKTRLGPNVWTLVQQSSNHISDPEFLDSFATQMAQLIDNHTLSIASITDPLTNVYNRRFFDAQLSIEIAKAKENNRPLSMLLIDADHFKKINDNFGHPAGDQVLKSIASAMRIACRDTDLASRIGGEEFAILLSNTNATGAKVFADRLREQIADTKIKTLINGAETNLSVTVSCGVAQLSEALASADTIYKACDEALYSAKSSGRNNVKIAA
jgi:diguanylate cyclase (GGDEF)-like protein